MGKPLNLVMKGFWQLYVGQNYERDRFRLFARLIEATAHFRRAIAYPASLATSERRLAHVFAWYCPVLQDLDIEDLESEVWKLYPRLCPFCLAARCACPPHEVRGASRMDEVSGSALRSYPRKPRSADEWQLMFFDLYGDRVLKQSGRRRRSRPGVPSDAMVGLFNELIEHLGRLAAALRLAPFARAALREELAHFYAWVCVTANALGPAYGRDGLVMLTAMIDANFVDGCCDVCRESVCVCRPKPLEEALAQEGIVDSVYDIATGVLGAHGFRRDYRVFRRNMGQGPSAIIAFDCDDLKRVNDQWDHSAGNAYLKTISEVVSRVVGARGTVYRVTRGDEFAVLLPNVAAPEAEQLALDIVARLRGTRVVVPSDPSAELFASATLGLATSASLADDQSDLFQLADQALMRGKKIGRGMAFGPGGRRLGGPAVVAGDALYSPSADGITRPNVLPEP